MPTQELQTLDLKDFGLQLALLGQEGSAAALSAQVAEIRSNATCVKQLPAK